MINDASVVIGGGNWGIKEADVLGYKLINDEYYARDIDFANSTAAGTYTDSTGVVRKAPYNLLQQSNTFSNAIWTKAGSPVPTLTSGELGRDGLNNAWRVQWGTTANTSYILQSFTITNHTASIYIKGTAGQRIRFGIGANVGLGSQFDLDGTWQRLTFSATSGTMFFFSTFSVTGTVASDFLIQDAQLVEGTEALPYFPTTTRLNVPRIDYRNADGSLSTTGRLLLEPQRTNSIRNSSMVGAVAGSPGTLPTNWGNANSAGLTRSVVGVGTENGLPYIDVRINGTASGTNNVFYTDLNVSASSSQAWTSSAYIKIISQPNPPLLYRLQTVYVNSGVYVNESATAYTPTTTLSRFTATHTTPGSTITGLYQAFSFTLTVGQTYDFTIRIAAPQMELGAYATTWIPTTTATVTRNADVASRTGVSSWIGQTEGTLFVEYTATSSDTTNATRILNLRNSGFSNQIYIQQNATNSFSAIAYNATNIFSASTANAFATVGVTYKMAFSYKDGDFAFYINGNQIAISSATGLGTLSIDIVDLSTSVAKSNNITQAVIFPTRLTNSQLQSLTTL